MIKNYNELIKQILRSDPQIRFAVIANNKGELIAAGKNNVETLLVGNEVQMSIHYALQKRELYTNLAHRIGYEKSSITEFDKITMLSIPINSQELFLISTEPKASYQKIIDLTLSLL